jgi:dephospho-CoA kinase
VANKIKIIGITGGIGAGKSLVCHIFQILGIPVFNADDVAKKIVETNEALKAEIIQLLGDEAYLYGSYNRKYVASQVFGNKEMLRNLNNLIHPQVKAEAIIWAQSQKMAPFYLYEAALMKAAGDSNIFDKVIVINAPLELRINNIKARDNRTETEILAIINNQITDQERKKIADFVIENDGKISLIDQILTVYNNLSN